ncbi:hypothetical protein [Actinoplanes sp. NPDC051859]|uniref:hypothetical protein n=1 Tax=Actinoplanes sp. NPDC051859 TaxID=3363909 RepID=UPI0037B9D54F
MDTDGGRPLRGGDEMRPAGFAVLLGSFGSLGLMLGSWVDMPWGAGLSYALVAVLLIALIAFVAIIMPQDSNDKVLWLEVLLQWRTRTTRPASAVSVAPTVQPARRQRETAKRRQRTTVRQRPPTRPP